MARLVGGPDGGLVVRHRDHREDRPEDLFLGNPRHRRHVGEDRRLEEGPRVESSTGRRPPAADELAFPAPDLHAPLHLGSGRVRGEDGAPGCQAVELGPQRALDRLVLEDCLYHEVGLGDGGDPALRHGTLQVGADPGASRLGEEYAASVATATLGQPVRRQVRPAVARR